MLTPAEKTGKARTRATFYRVAGMHVRLSSRASHACPGRIHRSCPGVGWMHRFPLDTFVTLLPP